MKTYPPFSQYFFSIILLFGLPFLISPNFKPVGTFSKPSGTFNSYNQRLQSFPAFSLNRAQIETQISGYINHLESQGVDGLRSEIITIPIVVHVIQTEGTNNGYVDYSSIQQQILKLNEHFRRQNTSEISTLPTAFQALAADSRIQFILAHRAENCSDAFEDNEPGVTRTGTADAPFTVDLLGNTKTQRYPMKYSVTGGKNGFSSNDYLNIWVCELSGDACGYASLPGEASDEDGIVIDYRCFLGTQSEMPFNEGKVLTQLVAQWLNLYNIWGIDNNSCNDSDEVDDTPNQNGPNTICAISSSSCGNASQGGDMLSNFMDFTPDNCRKFFTRGQVNRMSATLFTARSALLSSPATAPGTASPDIWMQDTREDIGNEPNQESYLLYTTQDIWIRQDQSPAGVVNVVHENPVYKGANGNPNYVYVRVRNRGCQGIQQGILDLYWAKAGSGLSWPTPWDGTITSPVLMGEQIGTINNITILAGESEIFELPWEVPNPNDYTTFGADKTHFCLLAVITTPSDAKPVYPSPNELGRLEKLVRNNNNVVWKNIHIAEPDFQNLTLSNFSLFNNFENSESINRLVFEDVVGEPSLFDVGEVFVDLGQLGDYWAQGGRQGKNIKMVDRNVFLLTRPGAYFGGIRAPQNTQLPVRVSVRLDSNKVLKSNVFQLNMSHSVEGLTSPLGGQTLVFKVDSNTIPNPEKWMKVNSNTKEDLYDAHFPSDKIGFAVGAKGTIIRTLDGGNTWQISNNGVPHSAHLYGVHFLDENIGFVVGSQGNSYKTIDGGEKWKKFELAEGNIRDIKFVNKKCGMISSENDIFCTTNGGRKWKNITNRILRKIKQSELKNAKIYFKDERVGFLLLSGKILKTNNFGRTWNVIPFPGQTAYDMDFPTANKGYLCGIGTGLLKSTDGGNSWILVNTFPKKEPMTLRFIDEKNGFVAGRMGGSETKDYGATWNDININKLDIYASILLLPQKSILLLGSNGSVFKYFLAR